MRLCKLAVCSALFLTACIPAFSQSGVRVNVPFNFTVGNQSLPAGKYEVVHAFSGNSTAWMITNYQGNTVYLMTNAVLSPVVEHKPSLLFSRFGGQYSLVQFWPRDHEGRDVIRPKIARTMIAQSELVQIAAER
jgi:hypothetical protein